MLAGQAKRALLRIATPPCPILQGLFEILQRRVLLNSPLPQHLGANYFGVVLPSCPTCCCSPLGFFHYSLPLIVSLSLLLLMPHVASVYPYRRSNNSALSTFCE